MEFITSLKVKRVMFITRRILNFMKASNLKEINALTFIKFKTVYYMKMKIFLLENYN